MKTGLLAALAFCLVTPTLATTFYDLQPPVEQGEKWSQKDVEYVEEVARVFKEALAESTGDAKEMKRDAHPKAHGCVTGKLTINPEKLAEKNRVGLFAKKQTLKTITRFSNGDPNFRKSDHEADVRGMATKILETPYENMLQEASLEKDQVHDLVFMNSDEFFISNPKEYKKFMVSTQGRFGVLSYLAFHWRSLGVILKARQKVAHSLDIDYRSATPYKIGPNSMKMKFATCKKVKDKQPKDTSDENFLSTKLKQSLSQGEQCFDFMVQINRDPKRNDIEDAIDAWNEKRSPYVKVGRLVLDQQSDFLSAENKAACEKMTFNPWRAPKANRPLGGVNRVRLEVYLRQFNMRSEYNAKN